LPLSNGFRPVFNGDYLNRFGNFTGEMWHAVCCAHLETAMKPRDPNSYDGQNWAWPEKTWFRERLNAIKAREQESRRKTAAPSQNPTPVQSQASDAQRTEER
jgi:hypothetical protein